MTNANTANEPRVALVTGAARRVGRAIAVELADSGCAVAVHYRRSGDEAAALVDEIRAHGGEAGAFQGDLADAGVWPRLISDVVQTLGRLDILVNNASEFLTAQPDTLEGFDPDLWESMLRVNLLAPMALASHARIHLAASGKGKVVNLLDVSIERPWTNRLAYTASKAALATMTKALAKAMAPDVQVTGVAPGIAVFPDQYPEAVRQRHIDRVPLKRGGSPAEVAGLVRFLCESGHYITGEIVNIDGGRGVV